VPPVGAERDVEEDDVMAVRTTFDDVLEQAVTSGGIAGLVAMAADESGVIYECAFGSREAGADVPMTLDTVFWIASMTKAVTSVAAMQLVERGLIDLDEPLGARFPELADLQVLEGFDAAGEPQLRPARGPVTMRQLLTHTAGFSGGFWNAHMQRYMEQTADSRTAEYGERAGLFLPLVFDPGERWEYGISTDWAGQIVEMVSGLRLDRYCEQHICGPLGMVDTTFLLEPARKARLARMHRRQPDGSVQPIEYTFQQTAGFLRGAGGLHSTGPDYLRFLRALLHGGTLDGAQILRAETVAEINQNQIGDIRVEMMRTVSPPHSNDAEFFPGMPKKWGLAYMINTEDAPTGRSAGSLAWAGLFNTYYWLDPVKRVTGLILTQTLPFADPIVLDTFGRFERAVYDAL
jgi:CubicO group peptidase (beta-lactamase class C family)